MKESLKKHEEWKGKIEVVSRVSVATKQDLSLAYTPGVAAACKEIEKDNNLSYLYTRRANLCAVITDGSAVLGLGNIGAVASMPVMEGKCALFKAFGDVDAIPICVNTNDIDEFVTTVYNISGSFGGINLEDISAPRCFEIEEKLKKLCDIPIFHDDQHGTAVVVLAALINSLKAVGKNKEDVKIVISGAGAAAVAITKLLLSYGFKHIIMCDTKGVIYKNRDNLNAIKQQIAEITNKQIIKGTLSDAVKNSDIFIGVSAKGVLSKEDVKSMNEKPIIFALANPEPEIDRDEAIEAGAFIVATGRSDYPNQINNVLAFPYIFRGAFDAGAKEITEEMKIASSFAIASLVSDEEIKNGIIIPSPFDQRLKETVSVAVKKAYKR